MKHFKKWLLTFSSFRIQNQISSLNLQVTCIGPKAAAFLSVQFSRSVLSGSLQPHELQHASLSITNSQSLLKLMSIESVMPSNHLILCHPLLLPHSIFPSIRVFSNESALHIRWPKYWSFSFSSSPSNEYSGLISFRMAWMDLLAVQGTLKSLLQHHNSSALSFLYSPTLTSLHDYWKNHSFDQMDLCQQRSCLLVCCLAWSQPFFKGARVL